jgi:hypothetical protein
MMKGRLMASFIGVAAVMTVSGCSMPTLEDPPRANALSAPPASNFEAAQATPQAAAPAPQAEPLPPPNAVAAVEPTPLPPAPEPASTPAAEPEPPQVENQVSEEAAIAEPPAEKIREGQIDAVYSSFGIEVSLGDGHMCVSDLLGTSERLKAGMVMPISCSDDRTGHVKIDKLKGKDRAEASLKLGAAKPTRISVVIDE